MSERSLPFFVVNAFTSSMFGGNPAAVVPLETALDDDLLLAIAAQHNLSETAYFEPQAGGAYRLRWFTPKAEVRLCGHATLATAWIIKTLEGIQSEGLRFETLSGTLTVKEAGSNALAIDFPAIETREIEPIPALEDALGIPVRSFRAAAQDPWQLIAMVDDQRTVEQCSPNFEALKTATPLCVAITAKGDDADFVSRFFAPHLGILEDPVTGSAHCQLAPMWAGMLDQPDLVARQLSERGGDLRCRVHGDRVELVGSCMRYAEGRLHLPK
jgi:PhzF family phenazine biosynthesis protein